MKVTMLGVNNAFCVGEFDEQGRYLAKFQSNILIEFDEASFYEDGRIRYDFLNKKTIRMVIDFGCDIRHALKRIGLTMNDIDIWYCSHPHADHIGGVEGIALSTFFNPFYNEFKKTAMALHNNDVLGFVQRHKILPDSHKPIMLGDRTVLDELWEASRPGLNTLQNVRNVSLETYFNVIPMGQESQFRIKEGHRVWEFYTVQSTHVIGGTKHMPSFGLFFSLLDGNNPVNIFFPTDTMLFMPPATLTFYRDAHVIYQDCETGYKSGVHSHIDDIRKVDPEIKRKLLLYHYNTEPEVDEDEFMGVLKMGDVRYF